MQPHADGAAPPQAAMVRFRRWGAATVALAALGYLVYAVWKGLSDTAEELASFQWAWYVPVLLLTLVNYGLRYAKWAYLLDRLGAPLPHRTNGWIFTAGLAMVISPGKAGELVKPYLVKEVTGTAMVRTIPALVVERGTDGLAVVILAAIGVSTYYSEAANLLLGTLAASVVCVAALSFRPLVLGALGVLERAPLLKGFAHRLHEVYEATWICLQPVPLAVTMVASLVAWFAECIGYWIVLKGLGVEAATLDASTFLYAFATVFGAPTPGGMGIADAALAEGALQVVPGITAAQALAGSILIRLATLWFGVALGAVALLRMERVLREAASPAR